MQGKKHITPKFFINFSQLEKVPENNFYRRLKHLLDLQLNDNEILF